MTYTITASYSSWIEFDIEELLDENEEYALEDIESYNVMRGTLYLTMNDGEVLEFDQCIETDFKSPNDVTLRNPNGDEIEVEDLPTLRQQIEMSKLLIAKYEVDFAKAKENLARLKGEPK